MSQTSLIETIFYKIFFYQMPCITMHVVCRSDKHAHFFGQKCLINCTVIQAFLLITRLLILHALMAELTYSSLSLSQHKNLMNKASFHSCITVALCINICIVIKAKRIPTICSRNTHVVKKRSIRLMISINNCLLE